MRTMQRSIGSFAFLTALASADAMGAGLNITFSKIADTSTSVPGQNSSFSSFSTPSIQGRQVAFRGDSVGAGLTGIYATSNSGLIKIVDTNTPIPGYGSSDTFVTISNPSLYGGKIAFGGARDVSGFTFEGVVLYSGGTLSVVAQNGTPVPGTLSDVFIYFFTCSLSGGRLGFTSGTTSTWGVFATDGGLHAVADESTAIPGTSSLFTQFCFNPTFSAGDMAFCGTDGGVSGVYAESGSSLVLVADTATSIPGGSGTFTGFPENPTIRDGRVAFRGEGSSGQKGVYLDDGGLSLIADAATAIPGGSGNFIGFDDLDYEGPALNACGSIAFRGEGSSGQEGIYATLGGALAKVIKAGDALDGKTVAFVDVGREAIDLNRVAFHAAFTNGTSGVFVATASIPEDLDRDGDVDGSDLTILLGSWGSCPSPPAACPADLDGDGDVDGADQGLLMGAYAACY